MADGLTDAFAIAIVLMVVAILVIAYLEMKYLRKSMKARRVRAAKRIEQVPDEAHNALITTKAFMEVMERDGVGSEEVTSLVRQAQMAYERRNYRVTMDLASQAKERMMSLKARRVAKGDLAKLETAPVTGGGDEATTKELLQKEFPPNLPQSRFTMALAQTALEEARSAGRDVSEAERLLAQAQGKFDGKDYTAALAVARHARRAAEQGAPASAPAPSVTVVAQVPSPSAALACVSCGTSLQADDLFCRKCGTKVTPRGCPTCGATLLADDAFCRKCGTRVEPATA